MTSQGAKTVLGRRTAGITYLLVVAVLLWLAVAVYDKKFTSVVLVQMKTDHTGNALRVSSDVKERGIIVGSVHAVKVDSGPNGGCPTEQDTCVTVTLALDPGRIAQIPNNVSALILPKTIFGEQYVSLQIPAVPSTQHIVKHDVIPQDRSAGALETEKVLGDLLPLLQAVKPAELNATLTAVAQALQGRGEELGQTLVSLDAYLKNFTANNNGLTKTFISDLKKLGQVSDVYNTAAPDLFATLNNLKTSSATLISQKTSLDSLLTTGTATSVEIDNFLAANRQSLITLTDTSDKIYNLLAAYSPEFSCLVHGLARLADRTDSIVKGHQFRLSAVIDNTNLGAYKPGQQPIYLTGFGPHCFGLPDNPQPVVNGKFQIPAQFRCLNDGAPLTADKCAQKPSTAQSASEASLNTFEGSLGENALVNAIVAGSYGTTPDKVPYITTMMSASLLRGGQVTAK